MFRRFLDVRNINLPFLCPSMKRHELRHWQLLAPLVVLITVVLATAVFAYEEASQGEPASGLNEQKNASVSVVNLSANALNEKYGGIGIIPRQVLFGNPDKEHVVESPDGLWLCYLVSRQY